MATMRTTKQALWNRTDKALEYLGEVRTDIGLIDDRDEQREARRLVDEALRWGNALRSYLID